METFHRSTRCPIEQRFDVAIIGGGPAGCAVAISLAQLGYRVALLERTNYTTARVGETLPPNVQPLLRDLGVWERFLNDNHTPAPGLVVQWGGAARHETDHIFNPYGNGWNLDRVRFDRTLCQVARERFGVVTFSEVSGLVSQRCAGHWLLAFSTKAENFNESERGRRHLLLRARLVVAATGRAALPLLLPHQDRLVVDNLVGLIGLLKRSFKQPHDSRIWIESVRCGWWYSVPLPDRSLMAVYLTDADLVREQGGARATWQSALEPGSGPARFDGTNPPDFLRVVSANSYYRKALTGEDYVLVGDAAFAMDPLSGQGALRALTEGRLAARAVDGWLRGDRQALKGYEAQVQKHFATYLRERSEIYQKETRWSSSPFWRRRRNLLRATVGGI